MVADGDTDGSWQLAEALGATVIRLPLKGGPARARNLGAAAATGNILYFVDADVAIPPKSIGRVVKFFEQASEVAALVGSYDDLPGAENFLSQYKNLLHHFVHQSACEEASTFWGACGAIRREAFFTVGGFDERYRQPSVEDIDLGYRLKAQGYRIHLCKSLQVKHLKRWEWFSLLKADIAYRALPWTSLIHRDRHLRNDLNLDASSRICAILIWCMIAVLAAGLGSLLSLTIATGMALVLLVCNASLYRFFVRKRGWWFTLRAIPWHWFYYVYSSLSFAIGTVDYWLERVLKFSILQSCYGTSRNLKHRSISSH